jgi:mRNA interferase HigB
MQIIARRALKQFWERYPTAEVPLRTWYVRVKAADWDSPADIKAMFGTTVDFVADNRVVFDLGGNKFRLIVHVAYAYHRVLIKFVGTHKHYDAINAETI